MQTDVFLSAMIFNSYKEKVQDLQTHVDKLKEVFASQKTV